MGATHSISAPGYGGIDQRNPYTTGQKKVSRIIFMLHHMPQGSLKMVDEKSLAAVAAADVIGIVQPLPHPIDRAETAHETIAVLPGQARLRDWVPA